MQAQIPREGQIVEDTSRHGHHVDHKTNRWRVRVWYEWAERRGGQTFGPFDRRGEAEACLIVLAGRADVVAAEVEHAEETA